MAELLHFNLLSAFSGLIHGISDRRLGSVYPEVAGGRSRLAEALGVPPEALVPTHQVHGSNVVPVPGAEYDRLFGHEGVDGLITATPGLFLLGYFADCVPILAYDPQQHVVGLAHAGWRGTLLGIAEELVVEMGRAFASRPGDLVMALGPSIGFCCYEIGPEVIDAMRGLADLEDLLRPARPGHAFLDLREANCRLLVRAGVRPEQIEVSGLCTSCQVDRFFSYRREGGLNGLFGAVIGLRETGAG